MALKSRVFRLFVSSTFSDFIAEREALQKHVFPKLEDYCAKRGASFQAIDLRWGITEEAQRDRETIQICLEEVRRCQKLSPRPNFAILLSHRYGWEPVPERISENHWARLIAELEKQLDDTALETLKFVYRLDTNAVPPTYCLEPDQTQINEPEIQRILRCAAESFIGFDRLPYFGSATHQEIALGALGISDAEEHVHAYVRRIKNLPDDATAQAFIDWNHKAEQKVSGASDSLKKLESKLRDRLTEDQVHDFECFWNRGLQRITHHHLKRFCDDFYQHQVGLIDQELARLQQNQIEQKANEAHDSFARERSENFVGRKNILDQIEEYLHSPEDQITPLIAAGEGGAGKTSIIAQSYLNTFENPPPTNSPVVLCRFIGGVAGVESLKGLLESLISEIATTYGTEGKQTDPKMESPSEAFGAALENATAEKPLWIFIDALDQLEQTDNLPLTEWLPELLPTYVRLVLSSRPEVLPAATHKSFSYIDINGMTQDEGDTLLSQWLASSRQLPLNTDAYSPCGRTLTPEQRRLLLESFKEHGNPLWLKLAYENARRWHSWDCPQRLPSTVAELVETFIETYLIEQRKHPPIFTRKALSYIAAGRYGLSEEEVTKALGTDPFVRAEFEEQEKTSTKWASKDSLPPILWSRLLLDLQPYLTSAFTDGALVYRYFHREFKETIERVYFKSKQKSFIHAHLAEVFSKPAAGDLYRQTDASLDHQNSRAMRRIMEQPWQLTEASQNEKLSALLMDFSFCMAKCAANRSEDLVQDYIRALELEAIPSIDWVDWSRYIIGKNSIFLAKGNQYWPAHRILLQLALEHGDDSPLTLAAEKWTEKQTPDWECHFLGNRPEIRPRDNCIAILRNRRKKVGGAERISRYRIVTWSSGDGALTFWSVKTGQCLGAIYGHTAPIIGVLELSNGNLLSYSDDNTLRIWSPKGDCLAVLEGHSSGVSGAHELSSGLIVSWDSGGAIRLWSSKGNFVAFGRVHASLIESITEVKELSSGQFLTISGDCTWGLWSTKVREPCKLMDSLREHQPQSWRHFSSYTLRSPDGSEFCLLECLQLNGGAVDLPSGHLLSWSENKCQVWSPSAECIAVFKGHIEDVRGATELDNGNFVSWSTDSVRVWSLTGKCLAVVELTSSIELGSGAIIDLPEKIGGVRVLESGELVVWDTRGGLGLWSQSGVHLAPMKGHVGTICDVLEIPGAAIVSYAQDTTVRLWDDKGEPLAILDACEERYGSLEGVRLVDFGRLLSWSVEGLMKLWEPRDQCVNLFECHHGNYYSYVIAEELEDGRLLSESNDGACLWSPDLEFLSRIPFRGNGRYSGGSARVLSDGRILVSDEVGLQLYSPDGDLLTRFNDIVSPDCSLGWWTQELADSRILSWSDHTLPSVWSSAGDFLFKLNDSTLLFNDYDGESVSIPTVQDVRELEDGRILVLSDRAISFWSSTGNLLTDFLLTNTNGEKSEFVRSQTIKTGRISSTYEIVTQLELCIDDSYRQNVDPTLIEVTEYHTGRVLGTAELADGRILTWASDKTLRIWSRTGKPLALLKGHSNNVLEAEELADGRLVSRAESNEEFLWSPSGGLLGQTNGLIPSTSPIELRRSLSKIECTDTELLIMNLEKEMIESMVVVPNRVHTCVETKQGQLIAFVGSSQIYPSPLKKLESD